MNILAAREQVARAVDSGLVTLYWHIGRRIRQDILKEKRAEYGAEIVATLSRQLEAEFGRGFSEKSLRHMLRFAEAFPDERIVSALRRQLGWTHFKSSAERVTWRRCSRFPANAPPPRCARASPPKWKLSSPAQSRWNKREFFFRPYWA